MKTVYISLLLLMSCIIPAIAQKGVTIYNINAADTSSKPFFSVMSSHPAMFTDFQGKLYFAANDSVHGYELFVLGSNSAPALVADIRPGSGHGVISNRGYVERTRKMAVAKDQNGKEWLFFGGWDAASQGMALYKYGGSGAPVLAKKVTAGANTTIFNSLVTLDNEVYFYLGVGSAPGYYKYDPVTDALVRLPLTANVGGDVAVYNNKLYLSTQDAASSTALWEYTPASHTARLVKTYPSNLPITEMRVAGGELFFMLAGTDLYQYDPNAPTHDPSVLDQYCFGPTCEIHYWRMTEYKGKLVYPCSRSGQCVTCIYDPSNKQTQVLSQGLWPESYEQHKDFLYFTAGYGFNNNVNDTIGRELWEYRGGPTDTPRMVANIGEYALDTNAYSSCPNYITSYGDGVYFRGTKMYSRSFLGRELMKYVPQDPVKVSGVVSKAEELVVYPNPATNLLHINTSEAYTQGRIYNSMGQVVQVVNANSQQVNIEALPVGNYYLQLTTDNKVMSKQFSVLR